MEEQVSKSMKETVLEFYSKGGWAMPYLAAISVVGLAVIIWRAIVLNRAKINTRKFLGNVTRVLQEEGVEAAKELCERTRGPVAAILYAGLSKVEYGLDDVKSAIENAGVVQTNFLESGLLILTTASTVAPLMGFLGTVTGMIRAFNAIAEAGEVDASLVAGGISEALITTASGLIIAIPIHIGQNMFVSMIDNMVVEMEDSATVLIDTLMELSK